MGFFSNISIDVEDMIASGYDDNRIINNITRIHGYTLDVAELVVLRNDILENQGVQNEID